MNQQSDLDLMRQITRQNLEKSATTAIDKFLAV